LLHRALSLRFDTQDRSIVFSGDTRTPPDIAGRMAREAGVWR
jgi:hypothetical protein